MLLYNVVLGNLNVAPNPWEFMIDPNGNKFVAKDDIKQRIRVDKSVSKEKCPDIGPLNAMWESSNMQCFELLPNTRWVNNNKNMNPMLLEDKKETNGEDRTIVVYLTVASNYCITHFSTPHNIMQTYHKANVMQGCVVVLRESDLQKSLDIIKIKMYDIKKDKYTLVTIRVLEQDIVKMEIVRKKITDKEELASAKKLMNTYKGKYLGFKILPKQGGELITSLYIVDVDHYEELLEKVKKDIRNPQIVSVDPSYMDDDAYIENYVIPELRDHIDSYRNRSITQVGVKLPLDVIRRLKLLYVFDFDMEKKRMLCKKST